jgi:hypothetical protein
LYIFISYFWLLIERLITTRLSWHLITWSTPPQPVAFSSPTKRGVYAERRRARGRGVVDLWLAHLLALFLSFFFFFFVHAAPVRECEEHGNGSPQGLVLTRLRMRFGSCSFWPLPLWSCVLRGVMVDCTNIENCSKRHFFISSISNSQCQSNNLN